jgi:hypothetical protein
MAVYGFCMISDLEDKRYEFSHKARIDLATIDNTEFFRCNVLLDAEGKFLYNLRGDETRGGAAIYKCFASKGLGM